MVELFLSKGAHINAQDKKEVRRLYRQFLSLGVIQWNSLHVVRLTCLPRGDRIRSEIDGNRIGCISFVSRVFLGVPPSLTNQ